MTLLNKLTLVSAKRVIVRSEQEVRRGKLLQQLDEQLALAEAQIAGTQHSATRQVWVKDADGNRQLVTKAKRLRQWFWIGTDGKWLMEVRYGAKVLELSKGKRAVEVGTRDQLLATLKLVKDVVLAGELDAAVEAAVGARKLKLPKS